MGLKLVEEVTCEQTTICLVWVFGKTGRDWYTLPETNSSDLKMDGWNTNFLVGWPIFRGELLVLGCFRECKPATLIVKWFDKVTSSGLLQG